MVNNSKESAFGFAAELNGESVYNHGLTKREYFAAMAMQGILSNSEIIGQQKHTAITHCAVEWSKASVKIADALLYVLENNNLTETQ